MEVINNSIMVSVIIPNYNHAPFLTERIESVLNQTYQDFEVIILDDCSTDNSREIIEKYRNHPKVSKIVYNETNSGSTFRQWQKGFGLAKGEYIWIAESDDVAHPEFLEAVVNEMSRQDNVVLGFSSMIRIDENGKNYGEIPLTSMGKFPMEGKDFIRHNMLFGCHILNASSAVFKKSSLSKISDEYTAYKGSGDYLFWIEIANTGRVVKVNRPLDLFRNHSINKVTPRVVAEGIQFEETRKILQRLIGLGYVDRLSKIAVAGFWLRKIRHCKIFKTEEIRRGCKEMWSSDSVSPVIAEAIYLIWGGGRLLKKKLSR